jgi:hypothetical protein
MLAGALVRESSESTPELCYMADSTRTNHINSFMPIVGFHFPHDTAEVILYRKLRQVQMTRDLFVGHPLFDEVHELELPLGQGILNVLRRNSKLGPHPVLLTGEPEPCRAGEGRRPLAPCDTEDGGDNFGSRRFLEHEPAHPQVDRSEEQLRILIHSKQDYFNLCRLAGEFVEQT